MCRGCFVDTTNVVFSPAGKAARGTPSHYNRKGYHLTAKHNGAPCIEYIPDNSPTNKNTM